MPHSDLVAFSLDDLERSAYTLLDGRPDPIPAYRLLNEVLRLQAENPKLIQARQAAAQSKWMKQLEAAQLPDGSWGRFHSQDTKQKSVFRTSEEAIDRAFSLGVQPDQPVLYKARKYIEKVLSGQAQISDRAEKSMAWPLLIKLMLAGRLAALSGRWPALRDKGRENDPASPLVDESWECLAEVVRRAFASGQYSLANEKAGFFDMTGTPVRNGFLESQHALWILSARPLPGRLEQDLVRWIWNKPDGIRYVRVPLGDPQPRTIAYWFRSMNILARFPSWRAAGAGTLNRLWKQGKRNGLWDFGPRTAMCNDFPISENWRRLLKRKVDYSTCVLVVLRRWFDI